MICILARFYDLLLLFVFVKLFLLNCIYFLFFQSSTNVTKDGIINAAKQFINFVNKGPSPFHGMMCIYEMIWSLTVI
jgi:hypothetical protein